MLKRYDTAVRQTIFFAVISAIFICPYLYKVGLGPVTGTYKGAAWDFWLRVNPYFYGVWGGDWFKYSPFFAFSYSPFILFGSKAQALLWGLTNIVVFWWGIARWFTFRKGTSGWLWFAAILCSMELDGSSRYQQVNALLVGMILVALADYRDGKFRRSGFWITVATNFKIIPGIFLLTQRWNKPFAYGVGIAATMALAIPLLWLGPREAWQWHLSWAELILRDMGSEGLLDIQSVLARWNLSGLGNALKGIVLVGSLASLIHGVRAVSVLLMMLILISPRTESATFVFAAPAFLFIADAIRGKHRLGSQVFFVVCAFFITLSFNDVWPKAIFHPTKYHYATKTLGMLGLWGLGMSLLWRDVFFEKMALLRHNFQNGKRKSLPS